MDVPGGVSAAATLYGLSAIGGKELVVKLLGPTFEYLGDELKIFAQKRVETVGKIIQNASKKLGQKIDSETGSVPPKVLKGILDDGSYADDSLAVEYFGGVLASSRSGISRDDRGAYFTSLIGRLSTYQLRSHYIFYSLIKHLFDGRQDVNVLVEPERLNLRVFIPGDVYAKAMDLVDAEARVFESLLMHTVNGLIKEDLIDRYFESGPLEEIKVKVPNATTWGFILGPSMFGIELFLWAHGMGNSKIKEFLSPEMKFSLDEKIVFLPGSQKLK